MINRGDIIDNRYNVMSLLGTGGMAVVFECIDLFTNKTVAIKILKEEFLEEPGMLEDFKREVKASVQMSHPNIMEIYTEGVWNKRPYLVLEYLKGETLLDKIEFYTKFTVREACEIMCQILDAVGYTHQHKIIDQSSIRGTPKNTPNRTPLPLTPLQKLQFLARHPKMAAPP